MKKKTEKKNGGSFSASKAVGRSPRDRRFTEGRASSLDTSETRQVVLVGTYKGDQLSLWRGWYNYPISDNDKITAADAALITEVWLFNGTKDQRIYKAEFVGIKTREELVRDYGYPAKGKAHGDKYLLFKTEFRYQHKLTLPEDAERVIIRTADFAKRSPKIAKQLKVYLESPDRKDPDLAKRLPSIITRLQPEQLRVCEAAVQLNLFSWEKLQPVHLPKRGEFTAVELFAGAGGLSIGLERAGIHVVIANEIMPDFAATLAANHPNTNVINEDIHKINFRDELQKLGLASVDVLSGGPPCQGFSTIGSKNRQDPRNSLFYEYLRAVSETNPKYTIFENVSGFKRMYDGFAYETLVKELSELGYETKSQILNAADYGAPQIRYRTVVLGWRRGLPPLDFPSPTNGEKEGLRPYLTLMEAISDLPPIGAGESSSNYATPPQNEYQRKMRGEQEVLLEHNAANYGEKMQEILRIIPEGGSISDLPMRLRPKSAYCNTYARLLPNEPSPTITRNFGTPSSSRCVHPFQPRALSTREGARLQGFPDNYIFVGGKQSKNLQIGNAVPPILGEAIATIVRAALQREGVQH